MDHFDTAIARLEEVEQQLVDIRQWAEQLQEKEGEHDECTGREPS